MKLLCSRSQAGLSWFREIWDLFLRYQCSGVKDQQAISELINSIQEQLSPPPISLAKSNWGCFRHQTRKEKHLFNPPWRLLTQCVMGVTIRVAIAFILILSPFKVHIKCLHRTNHPQGLLYSNFPKVFNVSINIRGNEDLSCMSCNWPYFILRITALI